MNEDRELQESLDKERRSKNRKRRLVALLLLVILIIGIAYAEWVAMPTSKHDVKTVIYTDSVRPVPHFVSINGDSLDGVITASQLSPMQMRINYTAYSARGCDVSGAQPSVMWSYDPSCSISKYWITMEGMAQVIMVRASGIDVPFWVRAVVPVGLQLDYGGGSAASLQADVKIEVPLVTNILWQYQSNQTIFIRPLGIIPFGIGNPDTKHPFELVIDMRASYPSPSMVPDADYPQFLLTTQRDYDTLQRGCGVSPIAVFTPSWCEDGLGGCYHYAAPAELDAQYFILVVNGIRGINIHLEVSAAFIEYLPAS
jgi:hypothetical protein